MAAKPMEGIQGAEHRDGAAPVSENGDPPPPAPRRHRERKWIYATVVLCCYGFFKEFKPSEPFLTPYLTDSNLTHGGKNFSTDDINELVYPIWTYSYGVSVFCALLLTDVLRYKPVILIECVSYLATRLLLIWGTSILDMQLMQVVYGVATATEIAYYSYIYVAVSITHFKQVTSYLRAMVLFGRSMSGLVGQLLVSLSLLNYLQLNYISFASVCVACVCAMFLPNICFSSSNNSTACKLLCCVTDPSASNPISPSSPSSPTSPTSPFSSPSPPSPSSSSPSPSIISKISTRVLAVLTERWKDFKTFYLTASLLRWSVWWAFATAGVLQVGNYVQSLWKEIGAETDTSYVYNGVVEAVTTLVAALAAFSLSLLRVNWSLWGEVSIGLLSLVQSLTLVFASQTKVLWLAYLCHVIYRTTYTFLITIASTQIAYAVSHQSYAFIFGINTFLALLVQIVLTLVVSDKHALFALDARNQFVVYAGYCYFLSLLFLFAGVWKITRRGWCASLRLCTQETMVATPTSAGASAPGAAAVLALDRDKLLDGNGGINGDVKADSSDDEDIDEK